jgi:hypothetical protein
MTAPIRQRAPLPASDERAIVWRRAARHDRAMAAAGVLPAKPRHARRGLVSLPRLSAHDHGDVTLASVRGELDLSGSAVLQAPLRDIRRQARLRSVADPTGYPSPGGTSLSVRCKPLRERTWSRRRTAPGHAGTGSGGPRSPSFLRPPSRPPISIRGATARISAVKCATGAGPGERGSVRRRRHVRPRHAHDHILGVHQRAAILPPCPESGQRRSSL